MAGFDFDRLECSPGSVNGMETSVTRMIAAKRAVTLMKERLGMADLSHRDVTVALVKRGHVPTIMDWIDVLIEESYRIGLFNHYDLTRPKKRGRRLGSKDIIPRKTDGYKERNKK